MKLKTNQITPMFYPWLINKINIFFLEKPIFNYVSKY